MVGGSPATTFNAAFSPSGAAVPEPATMTLLAARLGGAFLRRRRR
ncbi:PEP-CTERM sorting domain-containing protein [Roseiarcus fermentans]